MNFQEVLLAIFSFLSSLFIVILVVGIGKINRPTKYLAINNYYLCIFAGWYIIWKLFLSRFKLVRELLGLMNEAATSSSSGVNDTKKEKSSSVNRSNKERKMRRDWNGDDGHRRGGHDIFLKGKYIINIVSGRSCK